MLSVVRADVPGGLFTFDGADAANRQLLQPGGLVTAGLTLTFTGLLGGVPVGTDTFTPSAATYATIGSANLSGVAIDELRVSLPGTASGSGAYAVVDNLRVSAFVPPADPVPEPATLGACALMGVAGFGYVRRRMKGGPAA